MHTLDPLHFPLDLVRTDTSLSSSYLCPLQLPPTFPTPVCCRACTGGRGGTEHSVFTAGTGAPQSMALGGFSATPVCPGQCLPAMNRC